MYAIRSYYAGGQQVDLNAGLRAERVKNRFGKIALKGNVLTVIVNLESVPAMEN